MDSTQAFLDLKVKVADLEARLNLLSKWISLKFENDPTLPIKLISRTRDSSLSDAAISSKDAGPDSADTDSISFASYGTRCYSVVLVPANPTNDSRLRRRKQLFTNFQAPSAVTEEPIHELTPVTVKEEEEEGHDDTGKIRIVDMARIINSPADEQGQRPQIPRTRQPYVCSTCNRKFRNQVTLDIHKMTHCYVQITSLDTTRVQPYLNERVHEVPENQEDAEHSLSNAEPEPEDDFHDMDFEANDVDSDARLGQEARASTTTRKLKAPPKVGEFVCTVCEKRFSKHRYKLDHMRAQHYEEYIKIVKPRNPRALPNSEGEFMCTLCILPKKFTKANYLRDHKRLRHKEEYQKTVKQKAKRNVGPFVCSVCHKKYLYERYMKDHMRKSHREAYNDLIKQKKTFKRPPRKRIVNYKCSTCQESFESNLLLKQHRIQNHPVEYQINLDAFNAARRQRRDFKCKICKDGVIYHTENLLRKHKAAIHGISMTKFFKCEDCSARFFSRSSLQHHQSSVHQKSRPCLCPICGKGYPRKYDLEVHMDIHSEEKKYKCSLCEKAFRQRVGLMIHEKRHLKSNTQCVQCGQFYVNLQVLKKHEKTVHAGIRPFPCPKCDKSFKEKLHLNYHLKTHDNPHGRKRGLNRERDVIVKKRPPVNRLKVFTASEDVEATEESTATESTTGEAIVPSPEIFLPTAMKQDQIR